MNQQNASKQPAPVADKYLREFIPSDYHDVMEIYHFFDTLQYNLRPEIYLPPKKPARSKEYIFSIMNSSERWLYVCSDGGQILGLGHFMLVYDTWSECLRPRKQLHVNEIIIKNPGKKSGVADLFAIKARELAIEHNCHEVLADIDSRNKLSENYSKKYGCSVICQRVQLPLNPDESKINWPNNSVINRIFRKLKTLRLKLISKFWTI